MHQERIEEKLKALEAALNLTQAKNLPAVRPDSLPPVRVATGETGVSRELAMTLLKRMEEKIADLEKEGELNREMETRLAIQHEEQTEAIELIGGEVATLKQRTSRVEEWLRYLQVHHSQPQPELSLPRPLLTVGVIGIIVLGMLLFLVLYALKL